MSEDQPEYKPSHQELQRSISLSCERQDLSDALKRIGRIARNKKDYIVELDIRKDHFELIGIGVSFKLEYKADSYAKVTIPYQLIVKFVKGDNKEIFSLKVKKEEVSSGNFCVWSPFVTIKHPENQRRIDIPINYLPNEFLCLRLKYTTEELKDKNLLKELEKAEADLDEAIGRAIELLRPYEIRREDLEELIGNKIKKYLSI